MTALPALVVVALAGVAPLAAGPAAASTKAETTETTETTETAPTTPTSPAPWAINGVDVGALVRHMSVEQKVGQLLLVGFGGTSMDSTIATFLDEMRPGGIALFTRNITAVAQTQRLIASIREHDVVVDVDGVSVSVPPFIAVDQEGGNVVRVKSQAAILPSAMALGAADDEALAEAVGKAVGDDLVGWGFNMNLAPVLDVNSNPKNPVIGIRSFGGDPARVGAIGTAYMRGMMNGGIVPVAKHFPGHGDTDVDSHYGLPVLAHDRARLDAVELRPFARAFASGLPAVMTAHIALPSINGDDVPATVAPRVLTQLLREDLGYDGLVMTDGLEMQGIVERYGAGEAAVRAVSAGADMVMVLWFPEKKREVKAALLAAVASGRLPEARLDEAVRRVLEQKARAGLFTRKTLSVAEAEKKLAKNNRRALRELAQRAITIVKNVDGVVPVRAGQRVVVAAAQPAFLRTVAASTSATTVPLSWTPTRAQNERDAQRLIAAAKGADVVIVGMQTSDHAGVVRALTRALPDVRVVVVSFGSPWLIGALPAVDGYVCAFGWRDDSATAAGRVVVGTAHAEGKLPVSLAGGAIVTAEASTSSTSTASTSTSTSTASTSTSTATTLAKATPGEALR